MNTLFFNITDRSYKQTIFYEKNNNYIKRIDISNGLVFFDLNINETFEKTININSLDKMIFIPIIKNGTLNIVDNISKKSYILNNNISMFCTNKQDLTIKINKSQNNNMFVLFIADFILKRYLNNNLNEPIDYLYNKIKNNIHLEQVSILPIDALSLYLINKIKHSNTKQTMNSLICEKSILEFIIHRFSLLDIYEKNIDIEYLDIAKKAKNYLLNNFINPPSISYIAHICATNESKLKKIFKIVYKTTIHKYIQKLKLEEANILLKEGLLTIGQITNEIGYKHQGHFSKIFFQTYGVYPKDLLKK